MNKYLKEILSGDRPKIDIWHYFVGNYRHFLYYSLNKKLIRKHIREQIEFRIFNMNPICYFRGECVECGCGTTELQMCNKSCEAHCYPTMMSKKEWKTYPKELKEMKVKLKNNFRICGNKLK